MLTRRATVEIIYNGKNITEDVSKDLINFSYNDNAADVADDISITLSDKSQKWLKDWITVQDDKIKAKIKLTNWTKEGDNQTLDCGLFIADEPVHSGPPSIFTLNGISIPNNRNFKDTPVSRMWKKANIKKIAETIAGKYGITLQYDASINPIIEAKEQSETPDMEFLLSLCKENGLVMKVYNDKLVIFTEQDYEARESIITITPEMVKSWNVKKTLSQTGFNGCKIQYQDKNGKLTKYSFNPGGKADKIFNINQKVKNVQEAERLCKSKLRELNKEEIKLDITMMGNFKILASNNITLSNFGQYDGKYYIDKASHDVTGGYGVSIEAHQCLSGY